MIHDDNKRLFWKLGIVTELCPGRDDLLRVVKLRTSNGDQPDPLPNSILLS